MTNRFLAAAAVAVFAATAVTGCAQSSTAPAQNNGAGDSPDKTVTVLISGDTNVQNLWEKASSPRSKRPTLATT
ncbi:hypothetical protein NG819_14630 [Pseudarthrobacter sp. Fe7]|nr:hypothetical protein NG819_14630 [Pseudarthrobacter sp. Fe7]